MAGDTVAGQLVKGGIVAGTVTATTVAGQVSANQLCQEVVVQADPDNGVPVFLGDATSQPFQLNAGGAITLPVTNLSMLYVKTASGTAIVNWIAKG